MNLYVRPWGTFGTIYLQLREAVFAMWSEHGVDGLGVNNDHNGTMKQLASLYFTLNMMGHEYGEETPYADLATFFHMDRAWPNSTQEEATAFWKEKAQEIEQGTYVPPGLWAPDEKDQMAELNWTASMAYAMYTRYWLAYHVWVAFQREGREAEIKQLEIVTMPDDKFISATDANRTPGECNFRLLAKGEVEEDWKANVPAEEIKESRKKLSDAFWDIMHGNNGRGWGILFENNLRED